MEQTVTQYHTIILNDNLPVIEKQYAVVPQKNRPDDDFWIKEIDKSGNATRYKVQHIIPNGPHTSSKNQHPIFSAFLYAYNSHEDIVLCPDDIWLMVCIYFSTYVNQNAEQLRNLFVEHEGKQLLTVVQVGLLEPNWQDFLQSIRVAVSKSVKNSVVESLTADFTTTGPIESMLSCLAITDTFKNYFEYRCLITRCGIRRVHFMGTLDDWQHLIQKIRNLKSFTKGGSEDSFASYIDDLLPIVKEFVNTYKNNVNHEFWNKVMDIEHVGNGRSGRQPGDYISGWFLKLCYGLHRKSCCHIAEIILRSLVVPVQVDNEITNISKMCYIAGGFHGVQSSNGCHKPVMSLGIVDDMSTIKPYKTTPSEHFGPKA